MVRRHGHGVSCIFRDRVAHTTPCGRGDAPSTAAAAAIGDKSGAKCQEARNPWLKAKAHTLSNLWWREEEGSAEESFPALWRV